MIPIEELSVFAKTIWGEARGESIEGQLAVAWVIRNRTSRGRWPDTVIQVCLQPKQFSIWNRNDPNFIKAMGAPLSSAPFQRAVFVALGALFGYLSDPTGGADHYHHKDISPSWSRNMTKTAEIGSHVFYRDN